MLVEYSEEMDFLDMSGASTVKGESLLQSKNMKLDVSGAGDITLSVECEKFESRYVRCFYSCSVRESIQAICRCFGCRVLRGIGFRM